MPNNESNAKQTLTMTRERFFKSLSDLIASGVTFDAEELDNGRDEIIVKFTGGY